MKQDSKKKEKLTNEDLAIRYWQESNHHALYDLCKEMVKQEETNKSLTKIRFWYKWLSDMCCYLGKWKEAIKVNKKRITLLPKEDSDASKAWNDLALIFAVTGDYKSASDTLKEAEKVINPDFPYNEPDMDRKPAMMREYYCSGEEGKPSSFTSWPQDAMYVLYPKILKKAPKCAFGWYFLARFYGEYLRYFNEALEAIEKAVALKPDWKPALAYYVQILSYIKMESYDDKKKKEFAAKAQEVYKKLDKEKALARKEAEEKKQKRKKLLGQCQKNNDYPGIIKICEEALKEENEIETMIDPHYLYLKCEACKNLERWEDVREICQKRLFLAKKKRELYDRYNESFIGGDKITAEEEKAFRFLDGTQSELSNFAWNRQIDQLEGEVEDSNESLKLAKKKLKK